MKRILIFLFFVFLLLPSGLAARNLDSDLEVFLNANLDDKKKLSGKVIEYVITLKNKGPIDARNVIVKVDYGNQEITSLPGICENNGKELRCRIDRLAKDENLRLYYYAKIQANAIDSVRNSVHVSAMPNDPILRNNENFFVLSLNEKNKIQREDEVNLKSTDKKRTLEFNNLLLELEKKEDTTVKKNSSSQKKKEEPLPKKALPPIVFNKKDIPVFQILTQLEPVKAVSEVEKKSEKPVVKKKNTLSFIGPKRLQPSGLESTLFLLVFSVGFAFVVRRIQKQV